MDSVDDLMFWIDKHTGGDVTCARLGMYNTNGGTNLEYGLDNIAINTWYMVTQMVNATGVTGFINAQPDSLGTQTFAGALNMDDAHIGDDSSGTKDLHGSIDEVSIYNDALTNAEVLVLYNKGRNAGCEDDALSHWRFDDATVDDCKEVNDGSLEDNAEVLGASGFGFSDANFNDVGDIDAGHITMTGWTSSGAVSTKYMTEDNGGNGVTFSGMGSDGFKVLTDAVFSADVQADSFTEVSYSTNKTDKEAYDLYIYAQDNYDLGNGTFDYSAWGECEAKEKVDKNRPVYIYGIGEFGIEEIIGTTYPYNITGTNIGCKLVITQKAMKYQTSTFTVYPHLTDFDTGIMVENLWWQSKPVLPNFDYVSYFSNYIPFLDKKTDPAYSEWNVDGEFFEGRNAEDEIVSMKGYILQNEFCRKNKKYDDYNACMDGGIGLPE